MISFSMIFNKLTGFYGLLAIFTGVSLSPLQLSMYIYSVAALFLLAVLVPHIRKQSPFQCLALAWFYLFDTAINTAYTTAFAMTWFLAISANEANSLSGVPNSPGSGTIEDTAGFTSPKYNVSKVDVIAAPAGGVIAGQDAIAVATASTAASGAVASLGHGVALEESFPSILLIGLMTLIRVYFVLVVMAYARQVLRQHMYQNHPASPVKLHLHTDGAVDAPAENPFASDTEQGQGWQGKVGRAMVKIGEGYWLGGHSDDSWAKNIDGRFRTTKISMAPPGTLERERRARSGTGPPLPPKNLPKV
ncbi:DUF1753-domain-containing protein [Coleophoma cylindrospora]|uniref:DUF1753-domain-containing protein n=1 Tax=Coleophoma cylindrospora TaxID=1849047 RepID=A0A3D8R6L2_9HELO|nr:DUF1753-domain-containing protein [Coleophoma cylindrospora]